MLIIGQFVYFIFPFTVYNYSSGRFSKYKPLRAFFQQIPQLPGWTEDEQKTDKNGWIRMDTERFDLSGLSDLSGLFYKKFEERNRK